MERFNAISAEIEQAWVDIGKAAEEAARLLELENARIERLTRRLIRGLKSQCRRPNM